MNAPAEKLRHYTSQLDLFHTLCLASIGYCGDAIANNTVAARRLLAATADNALQKGNFHELVSTSGKIVFAHWASSVSRGLEFQKRALARLESM